MRPPTWEASSSLPRFLALGARMVVPKPRPSPNGRGFFGPADGEHYNGATATATRLRRG